jgi:hypothetical protein
MTADAWGDRGKSAPDLGRDTVAAVEFLRCWELEGPWVLTAIVPDGPTATVTFHPGEEPEMRSWIDHHQGKRNIYFSVNRVKHDVQKKTSKTDIGWMLALHVDLDPSASADLITEQQCIREKLQKHRPPPSVIISSGGGMQGFWLLEPVEVDDIDRLETYNIELERALSADHCHNLDRIMRLPGTINLPNRKKRLAGREPALASVVEADWDRRYRLDDFKLTTASDGSNVEPGKANGHDTAAGESGPLASLPQWCFTAIQSGDASRYQGDRSKLVFAVTCEFVLRGWQDGNIEALLLDPQLGISAHCREQGNPAQYARRQIERARKGVARDYRRTKAGAIVRNDQGNIQRALAQMDVGLSQDIFADRL